DWSSDVCSTDLRQRAYLDLDLAIVELAFAEHFPELLTRLVIARGRLRLAAEADRSRPRQESVEHALLRGVHGAMTHLFHLFLARHLYRDVHQVLDDRVDFATYVAHLSELRRLDLDERRAR